MSSTLHSKGPPNYVIVDLESTGLLFTQPDIVELSAITLQPDEGGLPLLFDAYLMPTKDLTKEATSVNGLIRGPQGLIVQKNKRELFTESPEKVLRDFISWLSELNDRNIYLLAYNAFKFDAFLLLQHFERYSLPYSHVIQGVCDPLEAIQRLPKFAHLRSKSLLDVCQALEIVVKFQDLHSGIYDSVLLRHIVKQLLRECGPSCLHDCSLTLPQYKEKYFKKMSHTF